MAILPMIVSFESFAGDDLPLHEAVVGASVALAMEALKEGSGSVDDRDAQGYTPLHRAAEDY